MGPGRFIPLLCVAFSIAGCCKDKPASTAADHELSAFAQKVHEQLDRATDPYHPNDRDAAALAESMDQLCQRREALRVEIASLEPNQTQDLTRQRIRLIRVERQIEMFDRLMTRYEHNASVVAQGN